jgi:putative membrane protein
VKYFSIKNYLIIIVKGMLMGIADLVPGISGGTIALITGIYKDLITALNNLTFKNIKFNFLKNSKKNKFDILAFLAVGISLSILLFSNIILFLLDNYINEVSSFFFGLIISSVFILLNKIKGIKISDILILVLSALIISQVLKLNSINQEITFTYIFICGLICSCAMILPGISGSYILLILGAYHFILKKLNTLFDSDSYLYISSFIFGGAVGIITFSRIIKWLFKSYEKRTMVVMIGFIIGSVSKIIPNKNNQENIFLITYDFFSTSYSLFFFSLIGFLVIILLNKISK